MDYVQTPLQESYVNSILHVFFSLCIPIRILYHSNLPGFRKMKLRLAQLRDLAQQVVRDANATLTSGPPVPGGKGSGKKWLGAVGFCQLFGGDWFLIN
jgi:hypothetical protein